MRANLVPDPRREFGGRAAVCLSNFTGIAEVISSHRFNAGHFRTSQARPSAILMVLIIAAAVFRISVRVHQAACENLTAIRRGEKPLRTCIELRQERSWVLRAFCWAIPKKIQFFARFPVICPWKSRLGTSRFRFRAQWNRKCFPCRDTCSSTIW
jgi:hypothetical protein